MDDSHTHNSGPSRQRNPDPDKDSTPVDILRPIIFSYVFNATSWRTYVYHKSKHGIPSRVLRQSLGSQLSPKVNDLFHAILDAMSSDEADVLKLSDNRCVWCGQIPRAGVGWTIWFTHAANARFNSWIHTWVYFVCGHECDRAVVWGMIDLGPPGHGVGYFWPHLETVVMWRVFRGGVQDTDNQAAKIPDIVVTGVD